MSILLYDYGHNFSFVKRYQSIPPVFSIGVWLRPLTNAELFNAIQPYGGLCYSRDGGNAVGLIVSGGASLQYVMDWNGSDFNRVTGVSIYQGEWQLVVGTVSPGGVTTWGCRRSNGAIQKDVNSGSPTAKSMKTWYCGVDSYDPGGRRIPGHYAMVALEQATWSENDVRRLSRGEPIERVRPQAYSIMRGMERRRTDVGNQQLISSAALKTSPNPAFLQTVPKRPQFVFAGTSPPPPPPVLPPTSEVAHILAARRPEMIAA